jgi:ABC-type multidrug transport system fused ATPase/permease subunit
MRNYFLILKRLWILFKPFHKYIYIQVGLVFLYQVLSISTSLLNSHLVNNLVAKEINHAFSIFFLWAMVIFIMNIVFYYKEIISEKYLNQITHQHIKEYSLRGVLNLTIEQHIEDHSAIKLSIIDKGESAASNLVLSIFTNIIPTALYTLVAVCMLAFYSPILALTSIVIIVILFFWAQKFRVFLHPYTRKNRDNWNHQQRLKTEAFTHLTLAKYFSRESFFVKKYLAGRVELVSHHIATRVLNSSHVLKRANFQDLSELLSLGIAAMLFLEGRFAIGTLYLVFSVTSRVYYNINAFSSSLRDLPIWFLDVEKYFEIIDKKPSFEERGLTKVSFDEAIVVNNLSLSYPRSKSPVLSNVSFTIPKHKKTAIVGASGSGKSTITKLLLRAYNYQEGSIKIGDIELKDIDAHTLREHIGYVEQHVDLLDESIEENILFGVKEKDKEQALNKLEDIAHLARIDQFYHKLGKEKFKTQVGERGIKLSGGERQRIGIARAIIKDPQILIFDEATSSLDTENESYVMEAINDVSKGKTTIIIAHRLSTVRDADQIIVMNKGQIVGTGTHDELLANNAEYQNLVAHQV